LPPEEATKGGGDGTVGPQVTTPTPLFEQFRRRPRPSTAAADDHADDGRLSGVVERRQRHLSARRAAENELVILPRTLLTVLDDAPEAGGFIWRKVREVERRGLAAEDT
jgi:hypothetical protein